MRKPWLAMLLAALPLVAHADWTINNDDSIVSFASIKNGAEAETHYFKYISGGVDGEGEFKISIDLASVHTRILVRDIAMKKVFFQTDKHRNAELVGQIDLAKVDALQPGEVTRLVFQGEFTLNGVTQSYALNAQVSRLSEDRIQVTSRFPLILYISDYELKANLEQMRRAAPGVHSISDAVPVSYTVVLDRQ